MLYFNCVKLIYEWIFFICFFFFFFLRKSEREYDQDEFFYWKERKWKNTYLKQAVCLYKRITNLKEEIKSVIQKWDNL